MASAAEIRAEVDRGNAEVEKAQYALRQATDKLSEALVIYQSVRTDKLDGAISSVNQVRNEIDQALTLSFGITAQASAYAQVL